MIYYESVKKMPIQKVIKIKLHTLYEYRPSSKKTVKLQPNEMALLKETRFIVGQYLIKHLDKGIVDNCPEGQVEGKTDEEMSRCYYNTNTKPKKM